MTIDTTDQQAVTRPGYVVWHSSEEDGGPDVGITVGLGDGKMLWVGERSGREGDGVGLMVYSDKAIDANASVGEYDEIRDLIEHHVAPALSRLASVSSASAEGFVLVPRDPTEAMLHAYQDCPYEGGEDKWAAMLAASPEPVPATNQAVKWRERWYGSEPHKGSAIVDERGNLIAYFGGDETTHKATTAAVSAHNAALATQPTTSLEGEALRQAFLETMQPLFSLETAEKLADKFIAKVLL